MRRAPVTVALSLALALPALACGDQESAGPPRPPDPPPPAEPNQPPPSAEEGPNESSPDDRDDSGGEGDRDDGSGEGDRGSGGGSGAERGDFDPNQPDTEGNDVPPPPGSPAERFERFCEQNPRECD